MEEAFPSMNLNELSHDQFYSWVPALSESGFRVLMPKSLLVSSTSV
jgi:hypothetical protein